MALASCPNCGGTGWRTVERADGQGSVAVRCECTETDRDSRLLTRARIPRRYVHCDFDNYDTDLYEHDGDSSAWNRSLAQAKLVVQSFVRDFPVGTEAGLLLMGPCGTGKTHLAVAALKALVLRGHIGLFYDYRELLKEIQASYNPVSQATEMDVLSPILTAEVLLLDDLGSSKPSAWALETVGHILNTRYNEKRFTLITTNYLDVDTAPAEPQRLPSGQSLSRSDETLAERIGQRIRSRLYEMCRTVEICAPDYRKEVRQAGRTRA
jgi:DNA replication protein DnaC